MKAIVKIYGNHVLNGTRKFKDVPVSIADEVREYILSVDPDFFDPDEEPIEENLSEPVNDTSATSGGEDIDSSENEGEEVTK